jgi:hypothetical protein
MFASNSDHMSASRLVRSKIVFFFLAGAWRKYSVPETAARLIRLVPLMAKQVDIVDRGRLICR